MSPTVVFPPLILAFQLSFRNPSAVQLEGNHMDADVARVVPISMMDFPQGVSKADMAVSQSYPELISELNSHISSILFQHLQEIGMI